MVIIACGMAQKPLLHSYITFGGSAASVAVVGHLRPTSKIGLSEPPPWALGVVVVGMASEDHDLDLKDQ